MLFQDTKPAEQVCKKIILDRLIQACRLLDLTLYDHLIINQQGYYSFKLTGLLAELAKSTKYRLPYEQDKGEESQEKDCNAMSQPN